MMISTRGRYALRVMLDMAEHGGGEWHRLSEAAQRLQLSKKYLESIMAALSRANLVESAVGKSGGYRLTRLPRGRNSACGGGKLRADRVPVRRGGRLRLRL